MSADVAQMNAESTDNKENRHATVTHGEWDEWPRSIRRLKIRKQAFQRLPVVAVGCPKCMIKKNKQNGQSAQYIQEQKMGGLSG